MNMTLEQKKRCQDALCEALIQFQLIEQTLKELLSRVDERDHSELSLGNLIKRFKFNFGEDEFTNELSKLPSKRNDIAHRAFLRMVEHKEPDDFKVEFNELNNIGVALQNCMVMLIPKILTTQ